MHFDPAILQFLAAPFSASLILTGIHAYLGVHVVERGVIFVDLSLAQIAALGQQVGASSGVLHLMTLVILFLMVFKPGS